MLCSSSSSQATQLLATLRTRAIGRARIRVLWGHHVPTIQGRIRRALLLSVMLLMVLLLIARSGRVILWRRGDLLVLVLGARGGAQSDLGRGRLLLMMLVLGRGRNGQRRRSRSIGGLGRAWASTASGTRATTSSLLTSARSMSSLVFTVFVIFLSGGGCTANGQATRDVICTGAWHVHRT
jgi:hypothetical protein